jgi:hypothetical protein
MNPSFFSISQILAVIASLIALTHVARAAPQGTIAMEACDDSNGLPVSARLQFTKSPRKVPRNNKVLITDEQWLLEQKLPLSLGNGDYEFVVKRGPEFTDIRGGFTIETKAKDVVSIEVPRSVDMHSEHWYSGDHLSSLPPETLSRWQLADAIDMAVSTTVPQDKKPTSSRTKASSTKAQAEALNTSNADVVSAVGLKLLTRSRRVRWNHGSLLIHNTETPSESTATPDDSEIAPVDSLWSALNAIEMMKRDERSFIELVQPWGRDVPLLLATGSIQSMQLLSESNRRRTDDRIQWQPTTNSKTKQGKLSLTDGKSKIMSELFSPIDADDELKYKDARGVGRLSEWIYWQILDAGLRIAPTAGSGLGDHETVLGYNRVYVYSEQPPTHSTWWQSVRKGETMVTNGPLLRVLVNGQPPGSVQASYRGQSIPLDIQASLTVRDPVDYLDVLFNGETLYSAKLEDHYKKGEFPPIDIDRSGWLVVRVVVAHDQGYRMASTAPFYFEFDGKRRVSKRAVKFFQDWIQSAKASLAAESDWKNLAPWVAKAEQFWASQETHSNAE